MSRCLNGLNLQAALGQSRLLAACLLAGLSASALLSGCGTSVTLLPSPPVGPDKVSPIAGSPIDHIVIIMQENRTFDN